MWSVANLLSRLLPIFLDTDLHRLTQINTDKKIKMSFPIQLGIYEIINKFFLFILLVILSPEELREKMKVSFNLSQHLSNSRLLTIPKVYFDRLNKRPFGRFI